MTAKDTCVSEELLTALVGHHGAKAFGFEATRYSAWYHGATPVQSRGARSNDMKQFGPSARNNLERSSRSDAGGGRVWVVRL